MATSKNETWYEKRAPKIAQRWAAFGEAVYNGALDSKTRELIAAASSSVLRCTHCSQSHIKRAKEADASEEEISEALMIAALISSGTQLFWMIEDYEELIGAGDKGTPWFVERTGEMGRQWKAFHDSVYEESTLDRKTKELIATAVGCLGRCTHCTRTHIKKALEHDASKEEVTEALMIASFFASTTQLVWMQEDYQELLG